MSKTARRVLLPTIDEKSSTGEKSKVIADWLSTNPNLRFYAEDIRNVPLFMYDPSTGIWHDKGTHFITKMCEEILGNRFQNHVATEVVIRICARSFHGTTPRLNLLGGPPNKIVCLNGVVDLDTGELEPFDPDGHHLSQIPVTYDPKEDCPRIKKFFQEVLLEKDLDAAEELFGYCLTKTYKYPIITVLVGAGRNGKTTFLTLLTSLLGRQNVSAVSLFDLMNDRFALENLHGKLANIPEDLQNAPIKDAGILKKITGMSLVRAQRKYFQPFDFYNFAKVIFACNNAPEIEENTDAIWGRIVVLEFPHKFPKGDPKTDPDILDKMTTPEELSGLLNIAIEGYRRLVKNGGLFTNAKGLEESHEDYLEHSSTTTFFIKKFLAYNSGAEPIAKRDVYEMYIQCCGIKMNTPEDRKTFGGALRRAFPNLTDTQRTIKEKKIEHYVGLEVHLADLRLYLQNGTPSEPSTPSPIPLASLVEKVEEGREDGLPALPAFPEPKEEAIPKDDLSRGDFPEDDLSREE